MRKTGLILLVTLGLLAACNNKNNISDIEVRMAQDDALIESTFENLDGQTENIILDLENHYYITNNKKSELGKLITITVNPSDITTFPKYVTIDFGTNYMNILNGDTIKISGIINVELTDRFIKTGAQRIVSYQDFYYNGLKIEGIRTLTNTSDFINNRMSMDILLEEGKISLSDSLSYTRNSHQIRSWKRGLLPGFDSVKVTVDYTNGINFQGYSYQRNTITPLEIIRCHGLLTIISGELSSTVNNNTFIIDYGNGNCDQWATIKNEEGDSRLFHYGVKR